MDYHYKYIKYKTKYLNLLKGGRIFNKPVQEPWFSLIKNGQKSVEGRLNIGDFKEMKPGDIVFWKNKGNEIKTKIIKKNIYPTFQNMLEVEGLGNVLPGKTSIDDGVRVYLKPTGFYDKIDEHKFGIAAIILEVL
jgi:ASC-1-like (ASCH) protein